LALRAAIDRPKTPVKPTASTSAVPATPPQRVRLDSTRTPISHKGLTMSPSASLAHYKSNLDPPPVIFQSGAHKLLSSLALESDSLESDVMRTPRKGNGSSSNAAVAGSSGSALLGPPVTPKKGLFESPFRTGLSPFRTPRSRDIYDPHDPRVLLDEELSRPLLGDSPVGIFGKRSSLLYDSPGVDPWSSTPGKYW
jgi:DNA ligase-4